LILGTDFTVKPGETSAKHDKNNTLPYDSSNKYVSVVVGKPGSQKEIKLWDNQKYQLVSNVGVITKELNNGMEVFFSLSFLLVCVGGGVGSKRNKI
jgi:hypothetical protein